MHLLHHQELLRKATSETLGRVIAEIRSENPSAFHVEHDGRTGPETLSGRVFFHRPVRNEPAKGFINPYLASSA